MFARFIRHYARINPKRTAEGSLPLRVSVLASILAAEVTVLAMGYYSGINVVLIPLLTAAGYYVSWRRRHLRNLGLKFALSLLVIAATVFFLRELAGSFYDTRLPLIKLFLWLQVLHSFDVPARRDLKFSLGSGLTLIAAGAVLATGMTYIAGLLLFSAAAAVSLVFFQLSEQAARTDVTLPAGARRLVAYGGAIWILCLLAAVPVFLLMPQSTQAHLSSLPFSDLQKFFGEFSANIINPSYEQGGDPFSRSPQFHPNAYFGFQEYMDLRVRGNLSDDIVMKVKSDSYDYYRGVVFDVYNGKGWEIGDNDTREIQSDTQPIELDFPGTLFALSRSRVQSFYIESDLPNIIFSSWKPESLYFPADRVKVDEFGSLRSPYQLTEGTVYSVVSEQAAFQGDMLRRYPRPGDPDPGGRYLELPASDGMSRVQALAAGIVRPFETRFDRVTAIERYLRENYPYDLGIAPQESSEDAVAYFLFEEQAGYCEHFASAMAVMARSVGIPARVVTGYTGGRYNPFTGLWEIRQKDAHAWVEIYFGALGWLSFDPTPSFEMPAAADDGRSNWIAGAVFSYLGGLLGSGPVGAILSGAAGAAGGFLGFLAGLPLLTIGLAAAAGVLLGVSLFLAARRAWRSLTRERRLRRRVTATLSSDYLEPGPLRAYFDVAAQLYRQGLWRRPDETLSQFGGRVSRFLGADDFRALSGMVETLRYQEEKYPADKEPGAWTARIRDLAGAVSARLAQVRQTSSASRRR